MSSLDSELARQMAGWEAQGLRRRLEEIDAAPGRVDFVSNDYLGLAGHADIVAAAREAAAEYGVGARASRLLGGGMPPHVEAESQVAAWLGSPAALLFASGYQANLGLVSALIGRGDAVFSDALNHASLIDAARLSRAAVHVFAHLDLDQLTHQLRNAQSARRRLVLIEGVFSMDGDLAPLAALAELCAEHRAELVVDEAHSVGLLGARGTGASAAAGIVDSPALAARLVTGGKSLGVAGAFVVGSHELRDHLANRARAFVYTTAPSPMLAAALGRAVEVCRGAAGDAARRAALGHAHALADGLGLPAPDAAIVPLVVGAADRAMELAAGLREDGFDVRAVRPPTVPAGTARLRLVAHAANSSEEIAGLCARLAPAARAAKTPAAALPAATLSAAATFVVGTDTGIGKTVVSALLLRALRRWGPVRYWKPVQTGADSDTQTVGRLAGAAPEELLAEVWNLPLPASPHAAAADAGIELEPELLAAQLERHRRAASGALLIELAGGLLVPYCDQPVPFTQADWLAREGASLVLVARAGLGTLNHTLLTLEALRARSLEARVLFLVGPSHASNRATLERLSGVGAIFEVPHFDPLDGAALDAWIDRHEAELAKGLGRP